MCMCVFVLLITVSECGFAQDEGTGGAPAPDAEPAAQPTETAGQAGQPTGQQQQQQQQQQQPQSQQDKKQEEVNKDPVTATDFYMLGLDHLRRRKSVAAMRDLKHALEVDPQHGLVRF